MKVRLLNPNIYDYPNYRKLHPKETSPSDPGSYPIVVEGFIVDQTEFEKKYGIESPANSIMVGSDELNRVFKSYFSDGRPMDPCYGSAAVLGWWNEPGKPKAWEPVGPFDFWNKLKASREIGETVGKGYL
ncbi:hypothetical protein [Escherichia phage P818]|nr:hypothetical protein [Escherichia phage P818]